MQLARYQDRRPQPLSHKAQRERALHLPVEQLQQQAMIYFIEEAFQINVHNVAVASIDVLLRLLHALLGISARAEAVAGVAELRLE